MMFRRINALPETLVGEWRDLLPSLRPLMTASQEAQRVIFAPAAANACYDLAADRSALERARPQIFAPFERCWIEMEGQPDIAVLWQSDSGEMQRGSVKVLNWPKAHPIPVIRDCDADIGNSSRPPIMLREQSRQALLQAWPDGNGPKIGTSLEEGEAIATPLLAAFALLATKGMTATKEVNMTKLNAARLKAGKYPLLGYTEICLNLDVERTLRETKAKAETGTTPQYQVRAHLRLLPTGRVTIVRAHTRGNPEYGMRSSHYRVVRDEDVNG